MSALAESAAPFLPRGVRLHRDAVRGVWMLLAPERAIRLDATGHAVLSRVDGERSFGAIVDGLAADFAAPRERIAEDAGRFLAALIERRIVELRP